MRNEIIEWLLEEDNPSVRFFTLTKIMNLPLHSPQVIEAKKSIMDFYPVRNLLALQHPDGWWNNSKNATMPMYTSTAWQLMLLAEMGTTNEDTRIRKAVDFVFKNAQDSDGAFPHEGSRFQKKSPMDLICNDALIAWGLIGVGTPYQDFRMRRTINFLLHALENGDYRCRFNKDAPCAWGLVKVLRVLSAVPDSARDQEFNRVIQTASNFILEVDLARAAFPTKPSGRVSGHWFKLGFPRSYQSDILQTACVLTDLGFAKDKRLIPIWHFLDTKKLPTGYWPLEETFNKWLVPFIKKSARQPSKWITWQVEYVLEKSRFS